MYKVLAVQVRSLESYVKKYDDFPKPGVSFCDIVPLLNGHFSEAIQAMSDLLTPMEWQNVDVLAGIDSRGFIFAGALADKHNKQFLPVRKAGKLPGRVAQETYKKEYGSDAIEMPYGQGRMVIIDDVLATGGTLRAAANLANKTGYDVQHLMVLIDIRALNQFEWNALKARSVIQYQ